MGIIKKKQDGPIGPVNKFMAHIQQTNQMFRTNGFSNEICCRRGSEVTFTNISKSQEIPKLGKGYGDHFSRFWDS